MTESQTGTVPVVRAIRGSSRIQAPKGRNRCRKGSVAGPFPLSEQRPLGYGSESGFCRVIGKIGRSLGELIDGIRHQPVDQGRALNWNDERERHNVCIIGNEFVRILFPGRPAVGACRPGPSCPGAFPERAVRVSALARTMSGSGGAPRVPWPLAFAPGLRLSAADAVHH